MHQQTVLVKVANVYAATVIFWYVVTFLLINKASNCLFSNWPIHKILIELLEISIM